MDQEQFPVQTAVQRCDRFVGRTQNWLYDHLRFVPRHQPLVLADHLENRSEFPLLEARSRGDDPLTRRIWRRLVGERRCPSQGAWLRRHRPSVLHSHFGYVAVDDYPLRDYLAVPWVVGFYGADVYELGLREDWRNHYARLFGAVDRVLALGPRMAERLQELGCPPEKIGVHPLGVDVTALPTRARSLQRGDPLELLFAGSFRAKKGVEYVIRGAAKARDRGVKLRVTLVGDAQAKSGDLETKAAIFREIEALGMSASVTHHPLLSFDELLRIALACHVFVAPSVTAEDGDAEGTPFVLQQMMATSMPAIATLHSDIPYVFGEHADRLVRERDADAIALRLQEYAEEPERLVSDGARMRERIQTAFEVRSCAARLSDVYDSLQPVARRSGGSS